MCAVLLVADTTTTWIAAGSIGTFVLALATGGVAFLTRSVATRTKELATDTKRLAEATEVTAQATRDSVEAIEEPFVIAVPTPREVIALPGQARDRRHTCRARRGDQADQPGDSPRGVAGYGLSAATAAVEYRVWTQHCEERGPRASQRDRLLAR